jgi:3-oxoacyl-(acyl-carrier-protein) synthase
VNYTIYSKIAWIFFLVAIPLLLYTLFFGTEINKGSRWMIMSLFTEYKNKLPKKILDEIKEYSKDISESRLKKILEMVLEEYEHANSRGAKIYAELAGFGMSGDAGHMTAPNMDGPRRCMVNAMRDAGLNPDQIQYLNAHGTSTPLGDKNETEAIKAALGDHAKKALINSTKSMTGHLLGGAGGLESVFTILALHNQKSPPTINIFNQDPECDLDYCANTARDVKIDHAVKNNFGFGGTNGTLIFGKLT